MKTLQTIARNDFISSTVIFTTLKTFVDFLRLKSTMHKKESRHLDAEMETAVFQILFRMYVCIYVWICMYACSRYVIYDMYGYDGLGLGLGEVD